LRYSLTKQSRALTRLKNNRRWSLGIHLRISSCLRIWKTLSHTQHSTRPLLRF
jgi:hypothetical protein